MSSRSCILRSRCMCVCVCTRIEAASDPKSFTMTKDGTIRDPPNRNPVVRLFSERLRSIIRLCVHDYIIYFFPRFPETQHSTNDTTEPAILFSPDATGILTYLFVCVLIAAVCPPLGPINALRLFSNHYRLAPFNEILTAAAAATTTSTTWSEWGRVSFFFSLHLYAGRVVVFGFPVSSGLTRQCDRRVPYVRWWLCQCVSIPKRPR